MMQLFLTVLSIILLGGCISYESFSQSNDASLLPINIDGVYKLSSETTTLKKPHASTNHRYPPDWVGLYHFQNGYFSVVMMNQARKTDWFTKFPENVSELGFESFAGTYETARQSLVLKPELALHPFYEHRLRTFDFKVENNNLILTENIRPYPENMSEGQRVIVLHKVGK